MPIPNFLIIGERRSGTTTLARYISVHPEIYLHPRMDTGFFIDDELVGSLKWRDGEVDASRWARTHDPTRYASLFQAASGEIAVGEKSADYLFWRPAHARIKDYLPDVKLVVIVRNPVERAWSHYWNEVGKGRETLPFSQALDEEDDRIRNSAYARDHLSYRTRGYYARSLQILFETFPKERVKVLCLEHLMRSPKEELGELYKFLGVDQNRGYENVGVRFNANWTLVKRPIFQVPGLSNLEELYYRATRTVLRRLTKDRDQASKWQRTLSYPFRIPTSQIEKPTALFSKMQAEYAESISDLESTLGQDFTGLRGKR